MIRTTSKALPRRERGAMLITGLILLAMVMLLGMAAMRTVTLQERLAGASTDYNQAFQAAEAALRAGEAAVKATTKPSGYHVFNVNETGNKAPTATQLAQGYSYWSDYATTATHKPVVYPLYGANDSRNPMYIVELQSGSGDSSETNLQNDISMDAKDKLPQASVYKVTALGRGSQEDSGNPVSDVVLQTTISQ